MDELKRAYNKAVAANSYIRIALDSLLNATRLVDDTTNLLEQLARKEAEPKTGESPSV